MTVLSTSYFLTGRSPLLSFPPHSLLKDSLPPQFTSLLVLWRVPSPHPQIFIVLKLLLYGNKTQPLGLKIFSLGQRECVCAGIKIFVLYPTDPTWNSSYHLWSPVHTMVIPEHRPKNSPWIIHWVLSLASPTKFSWQISCMEVREEQCNSIPYKHYLNTSHVLCHIILTINPTRRCYPYFGMRTWTQRSYILPKGVGLAVGRMQI